MGKPQLDPGAWAASQVSLRPLASLTPYSQNARTHSQAQILELAAAIEKWGWTQPIVVDEEGVILAGHARCEAARALDLAQVPVVEARGWSEAEKRAYVLADNRIALNAGWNDELLHLELDALREDEFDTGLLGWGAVLPGVDPDLDEGLLTTPARDHEEAPREQPEPVQHEEEEFRPVTLVVSADAYDELQPHLAEIRRRHLDLSAALVDMLREVASGRV